MGQQSTIPRNSTQSTRSYPAIRNQQFYNRRIQHQGLIKLRPVPFKNCIEIQTDNGSLFLENIQITLKDLLESRLYTNKLFPKEDIERLIENVTYTLAFLSQNDIPYKDVSPENIFYDEGVFKLLPNELIASSRYQRFLIQRQKKPQQQEQFTPLSPEMIIAYRCKQLQICDMDIIDKSNVFYLGMLLLQATTLLPCSQCYDVESCDILDEVINERIELVKEYYCEEIAAIVANMLDYDYVERMSLKQASIFVNRELNRQLTLNSKISKELSNKKSRHRMSNINNASDEPLCSDPMVDDTETITHHSQIKSAAICKSRIQTSDVNESRIGKLSQVTNNVSEKKRNNKTNKVYMNGGVQEPEPQSVSFMKEEKNKVYMKQAQQQSKRQNITESQVQMQQHTIPLRQNQNTTNIVPNMGSSLRPPTGKVINISSQQRLAPSIPSYMPKQKVYQGNNEQDQENHYPQTQDYSQQRNMKRKNSTDYLGYRPTPSNHTIVKTPKHEKYHKQQSKFNHNESYEQKTQQNNYAYHQNSREQSDYSYPVKSAFGQRVNERESSMSEDLGSRGYFQGNKPTGNNNSKPNTDVKEHDNSLSRIKSEIQRSRKLIEEFKRGETAQY